MITVPFNNLKLQAHDTPAHRHLNESGKTEFLSKKNIRIVEVEYRDGEENNVTLSLVRSINVIVVFPDGITLSGDLMAEVPEQMARLLDCQQYYTVWPT